MSAAQRLLPAGFEDLEPLAGKWLLGSERERRDARCSRDMESLERFYGLMLPRMDAIIAHLDQWPLDALPLGEAVEATFWNRKLQIAQARLQKRKDGELGLSSSIAVFHFTLRSTGNVSK